MKVDGYIERAVSLIRNYKECESFFYNFMIASAVTFFIGWFFWYHNRYLGAWTMAMSSFIFMISVFCWGVIRIASKISKRIKLMREDYATSNIR